MLVSVSDLILEISDVLLQKYKELLLNHCSNQTMHEAVNTEFTQSIVARNFI